MDNGHLLTGLGIFTPKGIRIELLDNLWVELLRERGNGPLVAESEHADELLAFPISQLNPSLRNEVPVINDPEPLSPFPVNEPVGVVRTTTL